MLFDILEVRRYSQHNARLLDGLRSLVRTDYIFATEVAPLVSPIIFLVCLGDAIKEMLIGYGRNALVSEPSASIKAAWMRIVLMSLTLLPYDKRYHVCECAITRTKR
jgi:hypothetical protein